MWTGKVAVFTKAGEPIQIVEECTPEPSADQILVRMIMAGICGSDAHRWSGDIAAPAKPICFGHEAVGKIEALGHDIKTDRMGTPITIGDVLYWLPSTPCGQCWECGMSNPLHCKSLNWPVAAGGPNGAGFREFATLSKKATYIKVPDGTSPRSVIAFGCAMPTALRGMSKAGHIGPETDVVIQGSGPVGLAATLLASLAGARNVIVIGDPTDRLAVAQSLGATETLSLSSTNVKDRYGTVQELTKGRGATLVVEAAGAPAAFPEGFDLLGMNGKYLILGLYSGKAITPIDPIRINNYNLSIIGSLGIEPENYQRTVDLATLHGKQRNLDSLVTHTYPLAKLEAALHEVAAAIPVKAVIVP